MERIHVAVRARPLSAEDSRSSPWRICGNAISLSTQPSSKFEFDQIFGEDSRTGDVYKARTKHIVDSAVRGFNGTVFAYGQTNSGKTYTMRGSPSEPGIIPLAVDELFQSIQEHVDREFLVRMSYMEIYNEEINDLLVPEHRKLQIHESLERGIYVAGLREEIVTCPEQVLDFMAFGESHRHIGETNMNLYSSRSHTIFRMIIESREKVDNYEGDSCDAVRVSILNLVDLAGSERAAKTGAEGMRLKEGSHINKSLMTLGTVIKKLSEGAESQGGHVPYRDSKLTRILQPALGGNANTAIICNITLAQVHADETKSSLLFASRALHVTNCVSVNEILTDAALLKRQRKEIEELRAKLTNSQSEHREEEILNLRNTLLQSELEKERIALELEEEKKAKEHHERRLIEQAKKIENLSSLVLHSERDDKPTVSSKNKRRVTWCPGPYWRQYDVEVLQPNQEGIIDNSNRHGRNMGMPLPFEELMQENKSSNIKLYTDAYSPDDVDEEDTEDLSLPDAHALIHVSSRRKKPEQWNEFERLPSKQVEQESTYEWSNPLQSQKSATESCGISTLSVRESEAILVIKQLQDQIQLLELEKSSIQNNLDNVLELATQQKDSFSEKCEELHKALAAYEHARIANEQLSVITSIGEFKEEVASDSLTGILEETQGLGVHVDQSRCLVEDVLSFVEELFHDLSTTLESLLEVKSFAFGSKSQFSSIVRDYEKLSNYLMEKVNKLETEKNLLHQTYLDQQNELQELKSSLEHCEKAVTDRAFQHELEKDSILGEVINLQKEVLALSSSSLMKEKESIRKELDRTKTKLRETESKLKNAIQDKIKLESEKALAEREIKKLQSQRTFLERDLRKCDSLTVDRRRESKVADYNKPMEAAVMVEQALQMQEEYQRLEVHAFELEAEIASLQEALITSISEKEEALSKVELFILELQCFENKMNSAEVEIQSLREKAAIMTQKLDASESTARALESSLHSISKEKEDMGMQLTDALLEMEAEKSMWLAKEKTFIQANESLNISTNEICKLSEDLEKVRQELACCGGQCRLLEGKKVHSDEIGRSEKKCCMEACSDPEPICREKRKTVDDSEYDDELQKKLLMITEERDRLLSEKERMSLNFNEAEILKENCNKKLAQAGANIDELGSRISDMEVKMHSDALTYNKESTKLRMQARWMQAKLDAHRGRLEEARNEVKLMDEKYQQASTKLKKELSNSCLEVMSLRKQLKQQSANQLEDV